MRSHHLLCPSVLVRIDQATRRPPVRPHLLPRIRARIPIVGVPELVRQHAHLRRLGQAQIENDQPLAVPVVAVGSPTWETSHFNKVPMFPLDMFPDVP